MTRTIERLMGDLRVTVRRTGQPNGDGRCIVYWMQRAQRAFDNPALDVAVQLANELSKPVVVFFAPVPFYPGANLRAYRFLAQGVAPIAAGLYERGIGFCFRPYPDHNLLKFCEEVNAAVVIGDENPLRETEEWRERVTRRLRVPFWTVDADVIVPTKLLAKEHFAARTIRPRLMQLLPRFLEPPQNTAAKVRWIAPPGLRSSDPESDFLNAWAIDRSVQPATDWTGGTDQAIKRLDGFVRFGIDDYPRDRNHPEVNGTSQLSPYLHFGHIGPHTVARWIGDSEASEEAKRAYLEQVIVRRELAINFVRFNPAYDSLECVEPWANRSLAKHASDRRPVVYSQEQLENAETHDPLWNAAHKQMVRTGWMHSYMRMYWAKKILEWSPSVGAAYQRSIYFNDRYELDGRDPNGYAGIAWALVGKHDRPWFDRPVFGQVRYMSFESTRRKFDSDSYIEQIERLENIHA